MVEQTGGQTGEIARPYCLRCEVPIYLGEDGVWRREATGVADCPRNPAHDGHEPVPTAPAGEESEAAGRAFGAQLADRILAAQPVPTDSEAAGLRAADVEALHRPVQWTGWALWLHRAGREPLAYADRWCAECRKEWPCPTSGALLAAHDGSDGTGAP